MNANVYNLFIKDFTNISLAGENGTLIKYLFLLSKNHCGVNVSSFSLLNLWKTSEWIGIWIGKPACKYLNFILFIYLLKLDPILLALCNSPLIALGLYLKGILLLQWTGNLLDLVQSLVLIAELCLTIPVFKKFVMVRVKFFKEFIFSKFFLLTYHRHIVCRISVLQELQLYLPSCRYRCQQRPLIWDHP